MTDAELAADIAAEAGALLLGLWRTVGDERLGAEGDARANRLILDRLAHARPDDAVLSEEHPCDGDRLTATRVWIVDPLDGTREYAERRDDWAVHIGLAVGGAAQAGAVAMPALGLVLDSATAAPLTALRVLPQIVVSRTRPPAEAQAVADAIGGTLVGMGSAGAKAMAVVRGLADAYIHSGGQYEWDNCAPAAVAQAAGLHVSRLDGSPLVYNNADPYLPDLLIAHPDLGPRIVRLLARS